MLRTTSSLLAASTRRFAATSERPAATARCSVASALTRRHASTATRALSNPTLANIEKRWEGLPLQEQADLWMTLRDRMKTSWKELSPTEKRAAYWISFGPHGPRAVSPPGEGWQVAIKTGYCLLAAVALFAAIRMFAKPAPSTMTKEYQEASNEFLKAQKSDPLSGISSEGYTGKGMVQSRPSKA